MENLSVKSLYTVLKNINRYSQKELYFIELLALRSKKLRQRKFLVRISLPKHPHCDSDLIESVYLLTLSEFFSIRRDLNRGICVRLYNKKSVRCCVRTVLSLKFTQVHDCKCYSCVRMK